MSAEQNNYVKFLPIYTQHTIDRDFYLFLEHSPDLNKNII